MHAVREGLAARGWQMGVLVEPPGVQMLLNHRSGEIADALAADMGAVIAQVRSGALAATGADMAYGV
jgi:hypothetical protein